MLHPCKQLPSGQVSDLAEQDQSKLTSLIQIYDTRLPPEMHRRGIRIQDLAILLPAYWRLDRVSEALNWSILGSSKCASLQLAICTLPQNQSLAAIDFGDTSRCCGNL